MEYTRNKEKDDVIKQEKKRLSALFTIKRDESKEAAALKRKTKEAAKSLIEEAAFMAGSLHELRMIINDKGYTEEYQNGANQKGIKKVSEVEIYNTMIKNYMNCVKQLNDMLPKKEIRAPEPNDGFDDFINSK